MMVLMQVVVKQFSGLGNQLFQYAAGRFYANKLDAGMRVAAERQHRAKSLGAFDRPMLLSRFSIEAPVAPIGFLDRVLLSPNEGVRKLVAPLAYAFNVQVWREPATQRHRSVPFPRFTRSPATLYLDGYWQTHTLADAIRPQLLRELVMRESPSGNNAAMLAQIQSAAYPVSIHVRRGDYALLHNGSLVLSAGYYLSAFELLRQHVPNATFFVFSDDPEHSRSVLPKDIAAHCVEGNGDFAAQEDMRLMSACKAHIIANSSFSWWGAWLNPADSKLVIAPKHWSMTSDSYYPELYPAGWLLVDTARENAPPY